MKKTLAIEKYKVRTVRYTNAVSHKYDNRRCTVAKSRNGYVLEFKIADGDISPRALCVVEKGKVAVTQLKLTQEAAEVLLLSLAEIMDFKIISE